MKLFDYECSNAVCDNKFEAFVTDDGPMQCPECKAPAVKLLGGKPAKSPGSHRESRYEAPDFDRSKVDEKHYETKITPIVDLGCAGETADGDHVHLAISAISRVAKNKA